MQKQGNSKQCPITQHQGAIISHVCLELTCAKRGGVCLNCVNDYHRGHRLCEVGNLFKHITQERKHHKSVEERVRADLSHLSTAKASHLELLKNLRLQIDRKLNEAEVLIAARFDLLEQRVQNEAKMFFEVERLPTPSAEVTIEEYIKGLKLIADELVRAGTAGSYLVQNIFRSVKTAVQLLDNMEKMLIESMKSINDAVKLIDLIDQGQTLSLRCVDSNDTDKGLKWSTTLKHRDIQVQGREAWRKSHSCDHATGILLEETISSGPSLKHSWSIRVLRKRGTMMFGICSISAAARSQFDDGDFTKTIGHGHYLISGTTVYSHHEKKVNLKHEYFPISEGDVLVVEYDRTTNTLIFNGHQDRYQLEVQQPKAGSDYHGCVYLSTAGDSVQVITHHI